MLAVSTLAVSTLAVSTLAVSILEASILELSLLASAGFPVDDWQFWVGTLVFVASLAVLVRPFLRLGGKDKDATPGCSGCPVPQRRPPPE